MFYKQNIYSWKDKCYEIHFPKYVNISTSQIKRKRNCGRESIYGYFISSCSLRRYAWPPMFNKSAHYNIFHDFVFCFLLLPSRRIKCKHTISFPLFSDSIHKWNINMKMLICCRRFHFFLNFHASLIF